MTENLVNPSVEIRLDGQDFILRYRAFAFIQYAQATGGDLLRDVRALGAQLTEFGELAQAGEIAGLGSLFEQVRDILWAGLVDAQPAIARDDVARLFTLADFQPIATAIGAALQAGLPVPKDAGKRPTMPAPSGRRRSSRSTNGVDSGPVSATEAESDSPSLPG
jgi:hypothetical protein